MLRFYFLILLGSVCANKMITIHPTDNMDFVSDVISNENIYEGMCDDSCPKNPLELNFSALSGNGNVFLEVDVNGKPGGLFFFMKKENNVYEVHTALLPNCRGKNAVDAGRMSAEWAFNNLPCNEIISYSLSDSPQVLIFAKIIGMEEVSRSMNAHTRHGVEVSKIMLSLKKSKWHSRNN